MKKFVYDPKVEKNDSNVIRECYLELLHREPDTDSLDHFLNLFEKKQINEKNLIDNIKTSNEYLIKICYLQVFTKQIQEIDFEYYDNYIKQNKINHDELIDMMKKSDNYNKFNFKKLFSKKYLIDKEYYCR